MTMLILSVSYGHKRKCDLRRIKDEIKVTDTDFDFNRVPFTHEFQNHEKRNKRKTRSFYDSLVSNLESITGVRIGEELSKEDQKLRRRLRNVFIMADDFEANSEILSYYGNYTNNKYNLRAPDVIPNNVSYYDVYTDFNNMYDTVSALMDISTNTSAEAQYGRYPGSEHTNNRSSSSGSGYEGDDSYYDRDVHLQYAQMYNDSAPLGDIDQYDPGYSAYDGYKDDYGAGPDAGARAGEEDFYNDPYMEEAYIDPYDGQGRIYRQKKQTTPNDAVPGAAANNLNGKSRGFPSSMPFNPAMDTRAYDELLTASYEGEILQFYEQQLQMPGNQSLLIFGRDILTNISLLTNILDYRLDSSSVVMIGGHGMVSEGQHVIDFTGFYDQSSQLIPTTDLLLVLQTVLSTYSPDSIDHDSDRTASSASHMIDESEMSYQPLQIHLDSCYAGDVAYQLAETLYGENVLVTNSKHQHPSISSLSSLKHKFLIDAVSNDTSTVINLNPYEVFLQSIDLEAVQYAKFITSRQTKGRQIREKVSSMNQRQSAHDSRGSNGGAGSTEQNDGGNDEDHVDPNEYIFSLSPSFQIITSPRAANKYLSKQVARFIRFSKSKTWNGQSIVLRSREFSTQEIQNFCGNLFLYLCAIGEPDFVSFLDTYTQTPDDIFLVSHFNHQAYGDYAIHMAVSFGHIAIVQIYLDLLYSMSQPSAIFNKEDMIGFDINLRNGQGITPLYIASQYGFIELIELFLQQGADVNIPCHRGTTPLFAASSVGFADVVEYLLNHKADLHVADVDGTTAFHMACQNNHVDVVKKLLSFAKTLDVDQPKRNGNTALHIASIRGNIDIVRILLDHKVEVNVRNKHNVTPLIMAAQEGHLDIIHLLLNHGAEVNQQTNKGTTALFAASAFGHTPVVRLLISHGADAGITTEDGFSPIAVAYQEGYDDIRDLLLQVSSNKICDERRCYA